MITKEEMNAPKAEVEPLNKKPMELSDKDLEKVSGGSYTKEEPGGNEVPSEGSRGGAESSGGQPIEA